MMMMGRLENLVPAHKISFRYAQWEDGAGLSLFEC
jgi:hypothetical protein